MPGKAWSGGSGLKSPFLRELRQEARESGNVGYFGLLRDFY